MRTDPLLHLNLLGIAFLLVEFGTQAFEILSRVGLLVRFAGMTLAGTLFVIQSGKLLRPLRVTWTKLDLPLAILFLPSFNISGRETLEICGSIRHIVTCSF